jgi:hypothetical protein
MLKYICYKFSDSNFDLLISKKTEGKRVKKWNKKLDLKNVYFLKKIRNVFSNPLGVLCKK